ncbi:MAG TPA: TraB/GumN family protein [Vicinamibacterales bacterium]|nr:TraB/GumN family protein [Vicinamibacterales bacterium]
MKIRTARLVLVAICTSALVSTSSAAQAPATGKHFLWTVRSGANVMYLAGSVHALGSDAYPLPAPFEKAFEASGTLVEELNLAEAESLSAAPMLLAKGMYSDGRTFEGVVSKETAALVNEHFKKTGLPVEMFRPMKPWMVMLMLTALEAQKAGLDVALGLDKYFYDKATAAKKTVIGLETAEFQIDRFDKMPDTLQEQMLRSTLTELDTQSAELKSMITAWQRGDTAAMEKIERASFAAYPAAYTSLIVERNRNWIPQLEKCLAQSKPCFVVVGAAHMVGPDGLVNLLKLKGYKVEQQ